MTIITVRQLFLKIYIGSIAVLFCCNAFSQDTLYVARKGGLAMREKPASTAKMLVNIPYSAPITIMGQSDPEALQETMVAVISEGMNVNWAKINYKGKEGYVIDAYLLPLPPPTAKITTMKQYLLQISKPHETPLVVKKGVMGNFRGSGYVLTKELFQNGVSCHTFEAHEYVAATFFFPDFSINNGFVLCRLIAEFKYVFTEKDAMPAANRTFSKNGMDYIITVEKGDIPGGGTWMKKINVQFSDGGSTDYTIFEIDGELVISYSSGV